MTNTGKGRSIRGAARGGIALLVPPIIARIVRRIHHPRAADEWEYQGSIWPPSGTLRGWNVDSVVEKQRSSWPDLVGVASGTGPLADGRLVPHNTLMSWAYALGRAADGRETMTFLDWGGGLGQYGLLARALYPQVVIEYFCRDLPLMAEAGRRLLPNAVFYDSDEDALSRGYDFVMASSSLQYVENWRGMLANLARSSQSFLFITRQPFVDQARSYVVVQRPRTYGYDTEYPGWVLNKREFLSEATDLGLVLVREFMTGEQPAIPKAPEQPVYRGFLFERQAS